MNFLSPIYYQASPRSHSPNSSLKNSSHRKLQRIFDRDTNNNISHTSQLSNLSMERDISFESQSSLSSFKIRKLLPLGSSEMSQDEIVTSPNSSVHKRENISMTKSQYCQNKKNNDHMTKSVQNKKIINLNEENALSNDELQLPKIYTPTQKGKIVQVSKMKESIFKPLCKQPKQEQKVINVKYSNQQFNQLTKGLRLKKQYWSGRNDSSIERILILQFDNLYLNKRQTFWEQEDKVTSCALTNQSFCLNPYCTCVIQKDLKYTLKLLKNQYYIVFIHNTRTSSQIWLDYFVENNFFIDATFMISDNYKQFGGGIKFNSIMKLFNLSQITQILFFNSIDISQFSQVSPDYLQYSIPIVNQNIQVHTFLINSFNQKYLDARLLYDICIMSYSKQNSFTSQNLITIKQIILDPIINYYIEQENYYQDLEVQLKQTSNNNQQEQISIEISFEQQSQQWLENSRRLLLEYFKSLRLENCPFFMIGDILRRNIEFCGYFVSQTHPERQKFQIIQNQNVKKELQERNKIQMDYFIVYL